MKAVFIMVRLRLPLGPAVTARVSRVNNSVIREAGFENPCVTVGLQTTACAIT